MDRESLIGSFLNGSTKGKSSSLTIIGNDLYSYSTVIARREGNKVYLNTKKYSHTTSTQQNAIRRQAESMSMDVVEVDESYLN